MGKKNANSAIDFTRLFAVKDQLGKTPVEPTPMPAPVAMDEEPVSQDVIQPQASPPAVSLVADAAPAPAEKDTDDPAAQPRKRARSNVVVPALPPAMAKSDAGETIRLRVGMTRELHERLRMLATLRGRMPTDFARDLLEAHTPVFDAGAPLDQLSRLARQAAPRVDDAKRVDVRMQVPVSEGLHQRLHQMAALRTQTLGTCLIDVLERGASLA